MRRIAASLLLAFGVVAAEPERGKLIENVASQADPAQTYTLYLPTVYAPSNPRPLLFIFDPASRGTRAAEIFQAAAEEYGWIILSSNGTKSGDGPANERALQALLPERGRYAHDPRRLYATGMSAGAMLSWAVGIKTGALAGVISCGGRHVDNLPPSQFSFADYGFAGDTDFNHHSMRTIHAQLERAGKPHRFETFTGNHRWMPPELAREAVGWMELMAMKERRRARDEAIIEELYEADFAAAVRLEAEGRRLDALERYSAVARTFDGLRPVDDARAAAARLERDAAARKEAKARATWYAYEERYLKDVVGGLGVLFEQMRNDAVSMTTTSVERELRIPELKRRATRADPEGVTARRLLETLYSQFTFLISQDLITRGDQAIAVAVLRVAAGLYPDRWAPQYNLAAALARSGQKRAALDALEKAIEAGLSDAKLLASDRDLDSIRAESRFAELADRIK